MKSMYKVGMMIEFIDANDETSQSIITGVVQTAEGIQYAVKDQESWIAQELVTAAFKRVVAKPMKATRTTAKRGRKSKVAIEDHVN